MNVVCIIGNGIIGLQTARELLLRDANVKIAIIGPRSRPGSASLAAAAMFNSYCEVDTGTFTSHQEVAKFELNRLANPIWKNMLARISDESGSSINGGFGTFLINNAGSDTLEDENFEAIIAALQKFEEPYDAVNPRQIPKYLPDVKSRATRAIYIPSEGWVSPSDLVNSLDAILEKSGRVRFIDDLCHRLEMDSDGIELAITKRSGNVSADCFVVCNGASFSSLMEASNLGFLFQRVFYGVGATMLVQTNDDTIKNCIRTPNRGLACGLYAAPQSSNQTLVGASNFVSPVGVDNVRLTSIYTIMKTAMEQLSTAFHRCELVRVNVGWRPISSDTLPMLGKSSVKNLVIATGTKRDGFHCSPVIARYLTDLITTGRSAINLDIFDPERHVQKYLSREDAIKTLVSHSLNAAYQHDFVPPKSRMIEDLISYYTDQFTKLHDDVGAVDWGIPSELKDMYRYGHIK